VQFLVSLYSQSEQEIMKDNTDVCVKFGKRLSQLRKDKKSWSQEQLALESGLARSYVSGVERGVRNISLKNICKLAEKLEIAPSELLIFPGE
jgi:transcriptional regulator with XRE-family HTH domain